MKIELPKEINVAGCEVNIVDNFETGRIELRSRFTTLGISWVTQTAIEYKREGAVIDIMVELAQKSQTAALEYAAKVIAEHNPDILIHALVNANIIQPETLTILKYWSK